MVGTSREIICGDAYPDANGDVLILCDFLLRHAGAHEGSGLKWRNHEVAYLSQTGPKVRRRRGYRRKVSTTGEDEVIKSVSAPRICSLMAAMGLLPTRGF